MAARFSFLGGRDSSANSNANHRISKFSLGSMGGSRTETPTPKRNSLPDLNRMLQAESTNQHFFFGPANSITRKPRVLHSARKIQFSAKRIWLCSEPLSLAKDGTDTENASTPPSAPMPSQGTKKNISSRFSAAKSFLGKKVVNLASTAASRVNEDSFCDGCGLDPIVGNMWSCSQCQNFNLCNHCYEAGVHGFDDSKLLKSLRNDFSVKLMMDASKNRVPRELFELLINDVCNGQEDKFKFISNWIVNLVLGHSIKKLKIRGIEIPHLTEDTRKTVVSILTPILAQRSDLEVNMQWFPQVQKDENVKRDSDPTTDGSSSTEKEVLRIWVATDKDSKSPFSSVTSPKTDESRDANSISGEEPDGSLTPTSSTSSPELSQKELGTPLVTPSGLCTPNLDTPSEKTTSERKVEGTEEPEEAPIVTSPVPPAPVSVKSMPSPVHDFMGTPPNSPRAIDESPLQCAPAESVMTPKEC